jgi:glycosyltransferase involved in cell wall biosynthesis
MPRRKARSGDIRLLTTMWNGDGTPRFPGSDLIDRRLIPKWRYPIQFVNRAARCDAVVVVGSLGFADRYQDVVAGIALRLLPPKRRPVLVVTEATWERSSQSLSRRFGIASVGSIAARGFIRALDAPNVVYCVLSEVERATFADHWGVDEQRVVLTHYPATLSDAELEHRTTEGSYLFAGGDPLRDYDLLLRATRGIDIDVRIAARRYSHPPSPRVTVGPVSHEQFRALEAGARVVVVPLRTDTERSAGQQTYLNALARGKVVIVTDAPGVRDYLIPEEHALVVEPTEGALRSAIERALDPANAEAMAAMAARGRTWASEQFTSERYTQRLQDVAETAAQGWRSEGIDLRSPAPGAPG